MGKAWLKALGCVSQAVFLLSQAEPYGGLMRAHSLALEVVGLGQAVSVTADVYTKLYKAKQRRTSLRQDKIKRGSKH